MSTTALDGELRAFALELFERSGGVAEWPDAQSRGSAVVPREVAAAIGLPGEEFALATQAAPGALQVGLAGEFLDAASRVLEAAVPREGAFWIPQRYLTNRDLTQKIDRTFGWQNARARYATAEPALVEYHLWTLFASLRSEDVWEGVAQVTVNAQSQAIVKLPDVFQEPDLQSDESACEEPSTYDTAVAEGKRWLMQATAPFVCRIEQRLERDRKRLRDYYRALSHQADGPKRRAVAAPSAEEVSARKRAVDLELRRKLAELDEQYALSAELRPVVLARVRLPALVVPITIQRKQACRDYRLYWNALSKAFEPMSCSRCRRSTFSATFTNEAVDLLCAACV